MYLPSGWEHLTLNIGEAIGVGAQVTLFLQAVEERTMNT